MSLKILVVITAFFFSCTTEQKFYREVNKAKKYMKKGFDAKTENEALRYFNKANYHLNKAKLQTK